MTERKTSHAERYISEIADNVVRHHPKNPLEWCELHRASHIGIAGEEAIMAHWVNVAAELKRRGHKK